MSTDPISITSSKSSIVNDMSSNISPNPSAISIASDNPAQKSSTSSKQDSLIQKGAGLQVVIGLGQSGLASINYLVKRGYNVAVTDGNKAPVLADRLPQSVTVRAFGGIDEELLLKASRIIISPGVSLQQPAVAKALKAGITIISDIQVFKDACTAPIVAITGSNAKSTVTTLVGLMAKDAGLNTGVGGNIGVPALSLLDDEALGDKMELAVLELSSFQLETVTQLNAKVATVLNMSPDHLDRHGDMLGYHQAKHRVFQGAQSIVINRDDALTRPLVADDLPRLTIGSNAPDIGEYGLINEGNGRLYLAKGTEKFISADELCIKGKHNLLNALAALAIGELAGLDLSSMLNTLKSFKGLPHRCEFVANISGVDYFNDSKGTNVGSTLAAISGLGSVYSGENNQQAINKSKLLLILGGQGKNQNFGELAPLINEYVSQVVLIGEDAQLIGEHLKSASLDDEVALLYSDDLASAMDKIQTIVSSSLSQVAAVLLSPACASFDQYPSYTKRGEHFCQLVESLK